MNLASSLIVDQKLINSAQDVWNYADNIATKCNLLTNDLILSAVWYCLNGVKSQRDSLSKNLNEKIVIDALQSGDKPAAVSEDRSCKSVTPGKADGKSVTDPVSGWVLEHIDVKSTKITPDSKESPIVIDCGSQKTITGPREVLNVGNKNVTSQNKCSNNGAAKFGKTVVSTPVTQTNKTVKSQGSRNVQDLDASGVAKISKENKNKTTAVNVQASSNVNLISSARQKLNSALTNSHSEKPVQKDKTIAEGVEIISIDDDDDEVEEIADNGVSCNEITVSTEDFAEEGDKNKEIVQEDEPDYFDMDCDEIEDDNYNEEETYDTSNLKVISPSTSHKVNVVSPRKSHKEKVILPSKSAIENVEGNDRIIKDTKLKAVVADVTVISDEESEEDEKRTITSAEKSSCLGTSNKSNLSSTESNNEIDSYGKGSKRKQSFIDIKVEDDIDGNDNQCVEENEEGNNQLDSIQKGSKRSRKQSFNDIKVKCDTKDKSKSNNENDVMCNPVAATFTCPVMEELDSMSMKRSSPEIMSSLDMQRTLSDIKSTENSVSEAGNQTSSHSQSSAVAMLGLVPVQIIQKSTSEVINVAEQTKPSAMALLGMGQTFYVTSGLAQGSIPSLHPFQGVNLAESSNTAANRFSDLYHSSNTQSTDLVTGVEYDQTEKKVKKYYCHLCVESFSTKWSLEHHLETHSLVLSHVCKVCKAGFAGVEELSNHMTTHEEIPGYTCKFCRKKFTKQHSLNMHILVHQPEKHHICAICEKSFVCRMAYQSHVETHQLQVANLQSPQQCGKCKTRYFRTDQHERVCEKIKNRITCNICGKTGFIQPSHLKNHIKREHKNREQYACFKCNKKFDFRWKLYCHVKSCSVSFTSVSKQSSVFMPPSQNAGVYCFANVGPSVGGSVRQ